MALALEQAQAPPPTRGWTLEEERHPRGGAGSPAYAGMDPSFPSAGPARERLPRLRGDGPAFPRRLTSATAAPPPTRGWTRRRRSRPWGDYGSPAYAGMDPKARSAVSKAAWLPRLRGDGPSFLHRMRSAGRAPPPTRGWTVELVVRVVGGDGSPAYAGMDPMRGRDVLAAAGLPRLRGDGPEYDYVSDGPILAPPPTRGWTLTARLYAEYQRGSPAYAGMDPKRRAG